jgi:hypothetical protein
VADFLQISIRKFNPIEASMRDYIRHCLEQLKLGEERGPRGDPAQPSLEARDPPECPTITVEAESRPTVGASLQEAVTSCQDHRVSLPGAAISFSTKISPFCAPLKPVAISGEFSTAPWHAAICYATPLASHSPPCIQQPTCEIRSKAYM